MSHPPRQQVLRKNDMDAVTVVKLKPKPLVFRFEHRPGMSVAVEGGKTVVCEGGTPLWSLDEEVRTAPEAWRIACAFFAGRKYGVAQYQEKLDEAAQQVIREVRL